MSSLRELQIGFVGAMLNPRRAERFGLQLRLRDIRSEQRIQIYRNNLYTSLTSALEAVYPVVRKLTGEQYFRSVAREYTRNEYSCSGDIHAYGHRFPEFLAALSSLSGHPYLPDVARLEWIYHNLFHTALLPALQPGSLQEVPTARYAGLKLQLQPASRLFDSQYPVLRIWQVNQDEWSGNTGVSLDEGGVRLLALRGRDGISFVPLGHGEYILLQAFADGMTLAGACELAMDREPDFDLQQVLARHITLGTFAGWQL